MKEAIVFASSAVGAALGFGFIVPDAAEYFWFSHSQQRLKEAETLYIISECTLLFDCYRGILA